MNRITKASIALIAILSIRTHAQDQKQTVAPEDWPCYGRDAGGARYSPLTQIDKKNVSKLKVAWTYRTGDLSDGKNSPSSTFEATPILADGTLYLSTPFNRVIALEPETGNPLWTFDPKIPRGGPSATDRFTSRGVSTWLDSKLKPGEFGRRRLFLGTHDGRLIALDAATGKLCPDFGDQGQINLKRDLGFFSLGEFQITSPPAIIGDLVIVGSAISDNQRVNAAKGVVRAFDARTGTQRWSFDPVPRDPASPARASWGGKSADITGAANAWAVITTDAERGLVFVPTSSPSPDFYGGERKGDNHYANSVVALKAETGAVVWHFQVVHHDIWDYDVPASPLLLTVRREGKAVPAVAVATKMGHLFLLHRETGKPLFPIEERPVPQEAVSGEQPSPTQPFPILPRPLSPTRITVDDAWGLTPEERETARKRIASLRSGGIFTPPSLQGTIIAPSNVGGMNWSGMAFDAKNNLLIMNTNRLATVVSLVPREKVRAEFRAHPDSENSPQAGTPYAMRREWLLHPSRLPMTRPPWGTLLAVDVNTGAVRWEIPLGIIPALASHPESKQWGSINMGGAMVMASGLVFIGATMDDALRAFDVQTGKELWKADLPAGGQALPMTFRSKKNGKQYIVICAGGHGGLQTTLGDYVIAFALSEKKK